MQPSIVRAVALVVAHRMACRLRALFALLALAALVLGGPAVQAQVQVQGVGQAAPIRFGILPLGGAFESRNDWEPLLADLGQALGRPVSMLSVTSYEALERAIERGEVDMAFLSGKMALDAVTRCRTSAAPGRPKPASAPSGGSEDTQCRAGGAMRVLAQVTRHDGLPGYRALLLTRKDGPPASLKEVLDQPERWRLARGESRSLSGYVVPQLQLFLPHQIVMETRFRSEIVGTHQTTALAVANGDADVATNNTADFERFTQQFPREAQRLQVVWQSDLIAHAQIVARRDYPPEFRQRVQDFLTRYGKARGAHGEAERSTLKALHDLAGFVAADNSSLMPAAKLAYQLAKQNALSAQWVNDAAREARLQRIESSYAEQMAVLRNAAP